MATLKTFLVLCFMSFLVPTETLTCKSSRCPLIRSPTIKFPFKLRDDDPAGRCGYPGFDLSCNSNNQTILSMPSSGKLFTVTSINYMTQHLKVNDPDQCLPGRYLADFSVDFSYQLDLLSGYRSFTFLNCTTNQTHSNFYYFMRFPCLSGYNYTVGAVLSYVYNSSLLPGCGVIKTASVPLRNWDGTASSFYEDVSLTWTEPYCEACEGLGGSCGFRSSSGLEVACSNIRGAPTGFSRRAKIGIVFGTFVGFIMLCFIAFHFSGKANVNVPQPNSEASMAQPDPTLVTMGLSMSVIESYPKHVFGESESELFTLDNMACPICLSEYKVKEEVRMISECNHLFHVTCVDEWLQRNATCPLCRRSVAGGPPSFVTVPL